VSDWQQMLDKDVLTLGMAADDVRRSQSSGRIVTYVRVQSLSAADLNAGVAVAATASEVRLYETPQTADEAIAQVRALRALADGRRVSAFSMSEIEAHRWSSVADVLDALVAAGLHDVAELPVDRLDDLDHSIDALRRAGADPQRITVSHPINDRQVEIISTVRRAVAAHPSVRRFSPLPRVAPVDKPTTGYHDVRIIALARLALPATSIEVDWTLYGPKLAQVALTFGADHLDEVAVVDNPALGRRRAVVEDVERNIKAAGFEPQEYRAFGAD
jgi:CofH/MqnC C-terminal region